MQFLEAMTPEPPKPFEFEPQFPPSARVLLGTTRNLGRVLKEIERGNANGLCLNPHTGFKNGKLGQIVGAPGLKYLTVTDVEYVREIEAVEQMHQLVGLSLGSRDVHLNLSGLKKLEGLIVGWTPKLVLPPTTAPLKGLILWHYRPRTLDLTELPHYRKLVCLNLNHGRLTSLKGIERFKQLRESEVCYVKGLRSIAAFARTPVRAIRIGECSGIKDFETLAGCRNLWKVQISNGPEMKSLRFLKRFKKLTSFRFVMTNVVDGNMRPLLELKDAAFYPNKRHFSHTCEEIEEALGISE
ncbi:MAG: hypothetical protein QM783_11655 [Phycisphaerales bacterium]